MRSFSFLVVSLLAVVPFVTAAPTDPNVVVQTSGTTALTNVNAPTDPNVAFQTSETTALAIAQDSHPLVQGNGRIKRVVGKAHFESFAPTAAQMLEVQLNELRIPDIKGVGASYNRLALMGATKYNFTKIEFLHSSVNAIDIIRPGNGVIDFNVTFFTTITAHYTIETTLAGMAHDNEGVLFIDAKYASVWGNLTMSAGNLDVSINSIQSSIESLKVIHMSDKWWMNWLQQQLNRSGRAILSTALGAIISTSVPSILNMFLLDNTPRGITFADGRKLDGRMEVVEDPVITPDEISLTMDIQTRVRD